MRNLYSIKQYKDICRSCDSCPLCTVSKHCAQMRNGEDDYLWDNGAKRSIYFALTRSRSQRT